MVLPPPPLLLHYPAAIALTPGTESGLQYPAPVLPPLFWLVSAHATQLYPPKFYLLGSIFRSKGGKRRQTSHSLISFFVPRKGDGSPQEQVGACQPKASIGPLIHIPKPRCGWQEGGVDPARDTPLVTAEDTRTPMAKSQSSCSPNCLWVAFASQHAHHSLHCRETIASLEY